MMNNPKVSVVVPVYNASPFLRKCVDSILSQVYSNFELLLMNDGSTDDSGKICDEYAQVNTRVKVFHLQNGGPSKARNIGIDNATGDLLAFVDSDDYIAKDMLEQMVSLIDDADIAMCNFYTCTDEIYKLCNHKMGNKRYDLAGIREAFMPAFFYSNMTGLGSCWNKFYNIKFITTYNIRFNEELIRAEDFWFNFECFSRAEEVVTTDNAFYYYQQINCNSTMHQIRDTQYQDWVYNRKALLERSERLSFHIEYDSFYKNFLYNVSVYLKSLVRRNPDDKKIMEILKNPFYLSCLQYDSLLPKHIRILNFLTLKNAKLAKRIYILWSRIEH